MSEQLILSYAQQRLWILDKLLPKSGLYNSPTALKLKGDFDLDIFHHVLATLINRHEALRTRFIEVNGDPRQIIEDCADCNIKVTNLLHLSVDEQNSFIAQCNREESSYAFDLTKCPLMNVHLLRLTKKEYILFIVMHHIITDGWSMEIICHELGELYSAFKKGIPSKLAELDIQYADFALWQREWLTGTTLTKQLDYWRNSLEGIPELIQLPTDKVRQQERDYTCKFLEICLPKDLFLRIREIYTSYGVTFYIFFMAVFQLLLHKYSGQNDIVVGSPVTNRHYPGVQNIVGFFANSLAFHMNFTKDITFLELLDQTKRMVLAGYENQDVPFEQVVDMLHVPRSLNYNPIFQTWFLTEKEEAITFKFDGLEVENFAVAVNKYKFDLSLIMREKVNGSTAYFIYAIDLFEEETIREMTNNFRFLLEAIAANHNIKINKLPILAAKNNFKYIAESIPCKAIHQLFEGQAIKTPNNIALGYEQKTLTYGELNTKANQLANYLHKRGIGRGKVVGIILERSLEHVIAVLGVLKSGAAYVPIDSNYPKGWIDFILKDTKASIIITNEVLQNISNTKLENLDFSCDPHDLACIIYTSGSTGNPKGVLCHHLGIVNRISWVGNHLPFTKTDVCCLQANLSFVDAIGEIFAPLCHGAKLVVMLQEATIDPESLVIQLKKHQISRLCIMPSLLNLILEYYPNLENLLPKLRHIEVSGEALSKKLAERALSCLPNIQIYDRYGSTEVTSVIYKNLRSGCSEVISNIKVYLLDKHFNSIPLGVVGELYLSGVGLAYGYQNQKKLTQEKFININGEKLYKTGDLAKFLRHGEIEILGRTDHLIKIRGFRIEPDEIVTILMRNPAVSNAVIIAVEDGEQKVIIAYLVHNLGIVKGNEAEEFINDIREHAKQLLPEYMVPSFFILLKELPLNSNGKVNIKALSEINKDQLFDKENYLAPQTKEEKILVTIWKEVLKINKVGVLDDFFKIGGNSILAIMAVHKSSQKIKNLHIGVFDIFKHKTIRNIAKNCKLDLNPLHEGEIV